MEPSIYKRYLAILKEELIPAMGCTEPIALAYAAALARQTLGELPDRVEVQASGNIIKNVKSVVVPNTGGQRGIEAAVIAGIVAGRAELMLEVLSQVTETDKAAMLAYAQNHSIEIKQSQTGYVFDVQIRLYKENHTAFVQVAGKHTNLIRLEKDGEVLFSKEYCETQHCEKTPRDCLSVAGIVEFADAVHIANVQEILDKQIAYNTAIAEEGLTGKWGASIGAVLLQAYGQSVHNRAKAMAAAGSDARMGGCELPVVINSGSGNQGMTASLPVIEYAKSMGLEREQLYRALVVSNLITIHLKTGIGRLSAYCGATSAGCGAGAGVCYLHGGKADAIAHTIVNALAIESGMVCDGAKPSCAAKIAAAVEAGLLGMQMQRQDKEFVHGEGLVVKGVENTIKNINRLAKQGMFHTDKEIIDIMLGC